jgi:tetratricopeptide (TPR) repeat protein
LTLPMRKTNLLILLLFLSLSLLLAGAICVVSFCSFINFLQSHFNDSDIAINVELEKVVQNNDIFNASLLLAQEYCPGIDIEQANKTFDKMTNEIRGRIEHIDDPNEIVHIINNYLFIEKQIQSDDAIVIDNLLLDKVLENRKGHCGGLSFLYLALGERLRLPLYAKVVPSHMYVCYDDGVTKFNIETTVKGFACPDSYYSYHFPYPQEHQAIKRLSKREVLGLFMGNLGCYLKQNPKVLEIRKKALQLYPDSGDIHTNTGIYYQEHQEIKKAKRHFLKAINLDPTSWQAYLGISNIYYESGDYKQAVECYTQTINLLHKSFKITSSYQHGIPDKETLIELAGKMLQSKESPYENLVGFGIGLFQQGEYELSNELFGQALKMYPEKSSAHTYYAISNFHLGNYEQARNHAQIADGNEGQDSPAYYIDTIANCYMQLGQSYALLKKYELALRKTNKAIEIGGPKHQFFCSMAVTYQLKEDKAEAIKYYKKALSLDPSNKMIQEKLSSLQSNKGDLRK